MLMRYIDYAGFCYIVVPVPIYLRGSIALSVLEHKGNAKASECGTDSS